MKTLIVEKSENIHKVLKKYIKSSLFKFRGQSDSNWELIPKAGRAKHFEKRDSDIFINWKRRAISFITRQDLSDWEYLTIAQHMGLPTRLLDWTHNPLTALFFAAFENFDKDGALWVVCPKHYIDEKKINPFDLKENKISFYQPITSTQRVANQFSYFSIHNKPSLNLTEKTALIKSEIEKIIIPKEIKQDLIFELNHYGINFLTIYPDLEGLSKHLSWFYENYKFWDGTFEE